MLTKGAIGNLVNRYKAVLKKCNLINTFGSLAVASMLVLGGAGMAEAAYWNAEGKTAVITDNSNATLGGAAITAPATDDTVIGGSFKENKAAIDTLEQGMSSNVSLNGGKVKDVIGGQYVSMGVQNTTLGFEEKLKESADLTMGDLHVTIDASNATVTRAIIGGSKVGRNSPNSTREVADINLDANGNYKSGILTMHTKSTNTVINGGSFGGASALDKYSAPTLMIVSGDLIKDIGWGSAKTVSVIDSANLTINGGTFDVPVISGSYGIMYCDTHSIIETTVKQTKTVINGGTFNQPVFAGGAIFTSKSPYDYSTEGANSNVQTAKLEINGGTFNSGIYAGGLIGSDDASAVGEVGVGSAEIAITNATVGDVFGGSAYMELDDSKDWGIERNAKTPVSTQLKLTNSTAKNIDIPEGSVELRAENGGTSSVDSLSASEVAVTADGITNDAVNGDPNALMEKHIKVGKVSGFETASISMEEGLVNGATTATIDDDGNITNVKQAKNSLMDAALQQASVNSVALDRILTNDVRKRLGDIRSDANTTGVWMRWDGGKLKGDSGLTNNFNTIQIGSDTKVAKNCRLGVAGSFTHGDTDFARGNGELEGFSFAAYATWMGENGMFADVVARLGHFSTEMNVEGRTGDMDNRVASISGEYGWRFNVCDQFFVEPQVELAYTYVNSEDLKLGEAEYHFDNVDSLTGRAGLVAGWNLPDDRGNVYARASVVQQFMGDAKISGSNGTAHNVQEIDGEDTWLEYGIGANVKLTDKTYVWADVERTEGAEIEEEWRGTVGVRFSF